jgi:2-polyprenyl-6-methoxyphenol hydroxylase-like FAD-dependent oxidoreductase
VAAGRDVGDVSVLKQYEDDRRVANAVMLTAVDGLKRVWSTSFLPLAALRNVGLKLTDNFSPLKAHTPLGLSCVFFMAHQFPPPPHTTHNRRR